MKISASCANKDETLKTNIVEFQVPIGTSMEFFSELTKKRMDSERRDAYIAEKGGTNLGLALLVGALAVAISIIVTYRQISVMLY